MAAIDIPIGYVIPITPRGLVNAIQVAVPVRSVPPGDSRWVVTLPIADCGFPIGFFRFGLIGNRQSQIGNVVATRYSTGAVATALNDARL